MKYLAVLLVLLVMVGSLIVLNTIYPVLPGVANITKNVTHSIADNWRGFLFGKKDDQVEPAPVSDSDAELEARIKTEVDKAVEARLAEIENSGGGSGSGLVVMPANQASTTAADIALSFSDQVEISPDATGRSGVIVPIFRDSRGEPYLYILTPIRQ